MQSTRTSSQARQSYCKSFPKEPGIYYLLWPPKKRLKKYCKILLNDPEGILVIGKAKNLLTRRNRFLNSLRRCTSGHHEGKLLGLLREYKVVPSNIEEQLRWKYFTCRNGSQAIEEAIAIKTYVLKFGQPPPLNSSIPDRTDGNLSWKRARWASLARTKRKGKR